MRKSGSFMGKCAIYVQDDYIWTRMREVGKRNCLGSISHVKNFDLAMYYRGKTLNDYWNMNDKITFRIQNNEIKRRLLLGRKVMTNLDSIFKSRDITVPTKVRLVKVMVFSVVMYGCESWTVKKAERRRIEH